MIEAAVVAGLCSMGLTPVRIGVVPTPAVALMTRETGAAFGLMVTASHNKYEDNGLKLFSPDGVKFTDEVEEALETAMFDAFEAGVAGREVTFQEYFVQLRHSVPVSALRFDGATEATASPAARAALADAAVVVIAPSNPLVSIGPVRALPGVDDLLAARRASVVAVSPIVGGAALKGPADRMMAELGHEPSVVGVARLYAPIASALVIDPVDAHLADAVAAEGIRPVVQPSVMADPVVAADLARATLAAAT